jgi:phage tail sheath protein FI
MPERDKNPNESTDVPERRLALFIEESILRDTQWAVFEPNSEDLWAKLRTQVGSFLHRLFLEGSFVGQTSDQAYFVKCDRTTMTQEQIDQGIVSIIVGFAPLEPAEFVVITIQQLVGQSPR